MPNTAVEPPPAYATKTVAPTSKLPPVFPIKGGTQTGFPGPRVTGQLWPRGDVCP